MRFGVREICDVTYRATAATKIGNKTFKKHQPVLYLDTAKTSTLEGAATTVYATGGKGNSRLLAWEGEKTLTFTVEDALISPLGLSVLTGAGLVDASATNYIHFHTTSDVLCEKDGELIIDADTLDLAEGQKALVCTDVPVFATVLDAAGSGVDAIEADITLTGTEGDVEDTLTVGGTDKVTFAVTGVNVGDIIRLDYYVLKSSGAQEIIIDAENFAGYYYVEASTLFRDQATGKDLPAEIIIPKAKIQSNFTFSMASSGDPSTFAFTMDAFPGYTIFNKTKKVLCVIQIAAASGSTSGDIDDDHTATP